MTDDYVNPFDDEQYQFTALINAAGQYSLWPGFAIKPDGWTACFGPAPRGACVDYVESHWKAINPFADAA